MKIDLIRSSYLPCSSPDTLRLLWKCLKTKIWKWSLKNLKSARFFYKIMSILDYAVAFLPGRLPNDDVVPHQLSSTFAQTFSAKTPKSPGLPFSSFSFFDRSVSLNISLNHSKSPIRNTESVWQTSISERVFFSVFISSSSISGEIGIL